MPTGRDIGRPRWCTARSVSAPWNGAPALRLACLRHCSRPHTAITGLGRPTGVGWSMCSRNCAGAISECMILCACDEGRFHCIARRCRVLHWGPLCHPAGIGWLPPPKIPSPAMLAVVLHHGKRSAFQILFPPFLPLFSLPGPQRLLRPLYSTTPVFGSTWNCSLFPMGLKSEVQLEFLLLWFY